MNQKEKEKKTVLNLELAHPHQSEIVFRRRAHEK